MKNKSFLLLFALLILPKAAHSANMDEWKKVYSTGKVVGLDVRSDEELKSHPAPGALHIPVGDVGKDAATKIKDKDSEIFIFCESGGRAEKAKKTLTDLGFKKVTNISSWREWNQIHK